MTQQIDAFWQHYAGQAFELIDGRAQPIPDRGYVHEMTSNRVLKLLEVFVETDGLGTVLGGGARFVLGDDHLRALDVAFLDNAQLQHITDPDLYVPFAPLLAVEVVNPRYTSTQIEQKATLLLDYGTQIVWVADPSERTVSAFYADDSREVYAEEDELPGFHILPGLSLQVNDLFPPLNLNLF